MALDKTKENTRIADLLAMSEDAIQTKIMIGIENPSILKQCVQQEVLDWSYTVPAGLLSESDVKWIKEHANEENSEETSETPVDPDEPLTE